MSSPAGVAAWANPPSAKAKKKRTPPKNNSWGKLRGEKYFCVDALMFSHFEGQSKNKF
jgi:hypothetical protein